MHAKKFKQHFYPKSARVKGRTNKQHWVAPASLLPAPCLIFDLFLNFYEFVLCSWVLGKHRRQRASDVGEADGGGGGGAVRARVPQATLIHKYFPCQQLICFWFICKCEFAFYVFVFLFTLYSHHEFQAAARPTPPALVGVNVFSFTHPPNHPITAGRFSLIFRQLFHSTASWLRAASLLPDQNTQ